jgi:hypothetical protein
MNRFSDPNDCTKFSVVKSTRQRRTLPSIPANLTESDIESAVGLPEAESLQIVATLASKNVNMISCTPNPSIGVHRNVLVRLKQKKARQIMEQGHVDDQISCVRISQAVCAPADRTRRASKPVCHAHDRGLSIFEQLRQRGVDEIEAACRQRIYLSLLEVIGLNEDDDWH